MKISERNRAFVCFQPIMRTHYIIPYEFFHLSDIMRENIIVKEKEGRKEKNEEISLQLRKGMISFYCE